MCVCVRSVHRPCPPVRASASICETVGLLASPCLRACLWVVVHENNFASALSAPVRHACNSGCSCSRAGDCLWVCRALLSLPCLRCRPPPHTPPSGSQRTPEMLTVGGQGQNEGGLPAFRLGLLCCPACTQPLLSLCGDFSCSPSILKVKHRMIR